MDKLYLEGGWTLINDAGIKLEHFDPCDDERCCGKCNYYIELSGYEEQELLEILLANKARRKARAERRSVKTDKEPGTLLAYKS